MPHSFLRRRHTNALRHLKCKRRCDKRDSLECCLCRNVFPFDSRVRDDPYLGLGGNEPLTSKEKVRKPLGRG